MPYGRGSEILKSAGLDKDAARFRSLEERSTKAYEAGRFAEGDRLAVKADVLAEKIDSALTALEEEGESMQIPPTQSVTRQFADAWQACMLDPRCREDVNEYRRVGHGRWIQYREEPGYFEDPWLLHQIREIGVDPSIPGALLIDAAEDAWNSMTQTVERIRAGAAKRRASGIDSVKEAKKMLRRVTRRKKRTSRQPISPNKRYLHVSSPKGAEQIVKTGWLKSGNNRATSHRGRRDAVYAAAHDVPVEQLRDWFIEYRGWLPKHGRPPVVDFETYVEPDDVAYNDRMRMQVATWFKKRLKIRDPILRNKRASRRTSRKGGRKTSRRRSSKI